MAKKVRKEARKEINPFTQMHRVFQKNISLQEVSIKIIGSYASRYDDSVFDGFKKTIDAKFKNIGKNKKKTITFTQADFNRFRAVERKQPQQNELFSKNTLVSIVSTLDTLTARLFEYYFSTNPSKLSIENQTLTFGELKEIANVADAEKYLISREVELLLIQKGFRDRLKILKDVLDINIPDNGSCLNALLKLIKIRNLIVHNEGLADADFIRLYGTDGMEVGSQIKVSKDYLIDSLYLVYFIGSYLLQEAQLKYSPDKTIRPAEYILNNVIHQLVKNCNFTYLGQIYTYSKERKLDQLNEKMVVVNYCIGLKKQGKDLAKIDTILKKEDWSAVASDFKMAIAALKGDDTTFYKCFEQMLRSGDIGESELQDWEIFSFYKKKTKFKSLVKKYCSK